jgi:hypothetical protein
VTVLRMLRVLLAAALLPVSLACEQVKKIDPPDLPKVDLPNLSLPKRPSGNLVLIENPLGGLQLDPQGDDAITALGACTDLITYCYEPGARSMDECVQAVPQCKTSKPWDEDDCCPAACADAYAKARDRGQEPVTAFEQTFFLEPDCFPGVRALLEGR